MGEAAWPPSSKHSSLWLSLHSSPWWLQNPSTSSLKQRTKAATPTTTPTLHHLQPTLHPLTLHHLLQPILHPPTLPPLTLHHLLQPILHPPTLHLQLLVETTTINTLWPPLQPTLHHLLQPTHHLLQPTLHLRPTPSTESRCT